MPKELITEKTENTRLRREVNNVRISLFLQRIVYTVFMCSCAVLAYLLHPIWLLIIPFLLSSFIKVNQKYNYIKASMDFLDKVKKLLYGIEWREGCEDKVAQALKYADQRMDAGQSMEECFERLKNDIENIVGYKDADRKEI